jgi:hypothetical protein
LQKNGPAWCGNTKADPKPTTRVIGGQWQVDYNPPTPFMQGGFVMHASIFIELTICTVSFGVALAAVWRLNKAEQHIRRLEEQTLLFWLITLTRHNSGSGIESKDADKGDKSQVDHSFRPRLRVITPA